MSLPVNWLGPSDLDAAIIQDKFVFGGLISFLSSLPSGEMNKSVVFKGQLISKESFDALKSTKKPTIFKSISDLSSRMGQIKKTYKLGDT